MPPKKNTTLRILVPLVTLLFAVGVAIAVWMNTGKQVKKEIAPPPAATPTVATTPTAPTTSTPTNPAPSPSASNDSKPASTPPVTSEAAAANNASNIAVELSGLKVLTQSGVGTFSSLGSLAADGPGAEIAFSPQGAGIASLKLAKDFVTVSRAQHVELQRVLFLPRIDSSGMLLSNVGDTIVPFSAAALEINGAVVPLQSGTSDSNWKELAPGRFEAFVVNATDQKVVRIERRFTLVAGESKLRVATTIENLTNLPLRTRLFTFGPVDMGPEASYGDLASTYGGDNRRIRYGYLLSPEKDPAQTFVLSDEYRFARSAALGSRVNGLFPVEPVSASEQAVGWPNPVSTKENHRLVWAGFSNRYYGVVVHSLFDPGAKGAAGDKRLTSVDRIDRIVMDRGEAWEKADNPIHPEMALRFTTPVTEIGPKQSVSSEVGVFAGPLSKGALKKDELTSALRLEGLVVFKNLIGPCIYCSYEVLGNTIFGLMHFLHDSIFRDWSLAIIFMVVVVRTVLHPVTRWSQIRMQRFGKQMQEMQPKIAKIQERFKDDKAQLQRETAKLWQEEGVSPLGMLGCLPMILVTPVWLAVYSVIFYAVELRHEGAFYGLFQAATAGKWHFLADLASPDNALSFGTSFKIPLISAMLGPISSLNILPLILGAVFFVHQKYLTPPSTVQLTPEQEQQQKIVKWMSVIMFPLFMYNSPAGLSLYFITNSTLAIFESKWIRAHAEKHGLLDLEKMRQERQKNGKGASGGGFMAKVMAAAEKKRQEMEQGKRK
ncbi:MAG: membrane protein insertase YidC [Planctomycetes bacterium]|nr:membrane protein insertase YidC [Planctomycetota bacterium]